MRTVVVGVILALVVASLSACLPAIGDTPTAGRCWVKFAAPYRPVITAGRLIRGQASALCTGPVDRHHVTLYLENNTGASWVVRDQDSSDSVPYPKSIGLTVILECRPGTWRLRYDVTATSNGRSAHANDASDQLAIRSQQDCKVRQ
jgi:hypothetical protein